MPELTLHARSQPIAWLLFPLLPLVIFVALLFCYDAQGSDAQGTVWSVPWVASMGINLSVRLDGLSALFAGLISGIGFLIQVYALAYLRGKPARLSFHCQLTLFMLAMLGLVVSDNLLLLFVFWELTTLTSYLLIGFNHESPTSRQNALQSLLVTGAGGLALLAGLIMLGDIANSYELDVILQQTEVIASHALFLPSMVLIFLGAVTKSAQFPFHFWLPNAMAAPTPVSAYLHSATMVKAGVYLLARFSPIYSHSEVWFYTLVIIGGITAVWCTLVAIRQTDLKLMLAYSTNVALGKLMLLLGIGTQLSVSALLLFIVAHALYKAALFMVVGNVDLATGTRDIRRLSGLNSVLVMSTTALVIAALSKAGLLPMMGFVSKEYMYKASLEIGIMVTATLVAANALMVSVAILLVRKPFFSRQSGTASTIKPVEKRWALWLPATLLASGSLLLPLFGLNWLDDQVITPGVAAILPGAEPEPTKLWQGFNFALLLSVITVLLGVAVYVLCPGLLSRWRSAGERVIKAEVVFSGLIGAMTQIARWQTQCLQHKPLRSYVLRFFSVLAGLLLISSMAFTTLPFDSLSEVVFYEIAIALLMVAAVFVCITTGARLLAIAALGSIGFMTTLVFMLYSAPDVAKTLLLVETLMVVFMALLMRHIPRLETVHAHSALRKTVHAIVAVTIGLSVCMLLLYVTKQPLDLTVTDFYARNSVPGGHGRNIVNVILVDFRALDTLGEALVVVLSGLAAVSLLSSRYGKQNRIQSLIFATTSHIVAALMLVFSLYLLLRGHNHPGGGFIGALIAVIGFSLLMFAKSPRYVRDRLHYPPFRIALFGVLLSLTAGSFSYVAGLPLLTGLWWTEPVTIGTPLMFDIGIYLAVIGGVMGMLLRINEELD
ncbi:hydrogen gas-evolving membrane-bound hydrogenase subunit E [Vibrio ostreae]|uniref:DUF4040 domain-containing protein n=1 Tax=Vibrio ostreae TaxID=2841925 RepID=A0A975UB55_9VIBR|nr:hydrogen gas-evolving membrane-bound hydrogenase subunit E [Vibrio ostreae]QXO18579.1 DUF4040 domain-containing protein [Vibrio ostreae]